MKKSILLSFVAFMIASLQAATYRVTPDAPGGGDGQSWESPMTIEEAIAAAKADEDTDDIILCKAGTYTPTATIAISTPMTVRGGLKGTDDEMLAENGKRSVFDTQNNTAITKVFSITTTSGLNTFEGVEICNAYFRGVYKTGAGSLSFKNCVFDSCGKNYSAGVNSAVRGLAGRFEGSSSANLSFDGCVFSRNTYEANVANSTQVGYGIAVGFTSWKRVTIDNSLFVSNGLGRACLFSTEGGKGINNVRGAAIYSTVPLTVRNTEFRANRTGISAAYGGIIYIRYPGGETTSNPPTSTAFTNCLFLANSCEHCSSDSSSKEAAVLAFRSKVKDTLDVVNCTFAYNFTASANNVSAGIDVGSSNSKANIRNTIFYGAQKTASLKCGKDICVSSGCTANIDYCLFEEDSATCISGAGTIEKGSHNVFGDPKFARAITAEEVASIMVKNGSYYGYSADAYETVFSKADVHALSRKLTVDTGDPASPFSNEPRPNGARVNLGYYGNTPDALSTLSGMKIIIR